MRCANERLYTLDFVSPANKQSHKSTLFCPEMATGHELSLRLAKAGCLAHYLKFGTTVRRFWFTQTPEFVPAKDIRATAEEIAKLRAWVAALQDPTLDSAFVCDFTDSLGEPDCLFSKYDLVHRPFAVDVVPSAKAEHKFAVAIQGTDEILVGSTHVSMWTSHLAQNETHLQTLLRRRNGHLDMVLLTPRYPIDSAVAILERLRRQPPGEFADFRMCESVVFTASLHKVTHEPGDDVLDHECIYVCDLRVFDATQPARLFRELSLLEDVCTMLERTDEYTFGQQQDAKMHRFLPLTAFEDLFDVRLGGSVHDMVRCTALSRPHVLFFPPRSVARVKLSCDQIVVASDSCCLQVTGDLQRIKFSVGTNTVIDVFAEAAATTQTRECKVGGFNLRVIETVATRLEFKAYFMDSSASAIFLHHEDMIQGPIKNISKGSIRSFHAPGFTARMKMRFQMLQGTIGRNPAGLDRHNVDRLRDVPEVELHVQPACAWVLGDGDAAGGVFISPTLLATTSQIGTMNAARLAFTTYKQSSDSWQLTPLRVCCVYVDAELGFSLWQTEGSPASAWIESKLQSQAPPTSVFAMVPEHSNASSPRPFVASDSRPEQLVKPLRWQKGAPVFAANDGDFLGLLKPDGTCLPASKFLDLANSQFV